MSQVHAVHGDDQQGRSGRQLPVRHHRAQRGHRAGARRPPAGAGRDRPSGEDRARTVEFVDIAGLVAGASQGEGLGNQFLANIRETDAIAEVVRFFGDPDVTHVAGKVDPPSDVDTIKTELILADIARWRRPFRGLRKRPSATRPVSRSWRRRRRYSRG